jgi:hypothetical protein
MKWKDFLLLYHQQEEEEGGETAVGRLASLSCRRPRFNFPLRPRFQRLFLILFLGCSLLRFSKKPTEMNGLNFFIFLFILILKIKRKKKGEIYRVKMCRWVKQLRHWDGTRGGGEDGTKHETHCIIISPSVNNCRALFYFHFSNGVF